MSLVERNKKVFSYIQKQFNIDYYELFWKNRKPKFTLVRWIIYTYFRKIWYTYEQIASMFNFKSHWTIINSIKSLKKRLSDIEIFIYINKIKINTI